MPPALSPSLSLLPSPPPMARKHLQDCVSEQRCRLQAESDAHMKGQFSRVGKRQAATETRENVGTAPLLLPSARLVSPRAFQKQETAEVTDTRIESHPAQEAGEAQRHRNWEAIVLTSSQRQCVPLSSHARRSTVIKYRNSPCARNASLSPYLAS